MKTVDKIILHCSDSEFGDVKEIDKWHRERGWDRCGYHFVITNGVTQYAAKYRRESDGVVQAGRPLNVQGAHCLGQNANSWGVCLIGRESFTSLQLFSALPNLLMDLLARVKLTPNAVYGHSSFNASKTCPNFNVNEYRKYLWMRFMEVNQ